MSEETPSIQFAPTSVTIQPGEQTTEYAMAELHNMHASLIKFCGSATGLLTSLADMLGCCPDNKYVLRALAIIGFALAAIAHVSHTLVTMNYSDGRTLIKAQGVTAPLPGPRIGTLILFAFLLTIPLSSAHAFANVEVKPVVSPEAVDVHGNGIVTIPKDVVHGEKDMIHSEPITGTFWGKAEALPGSFIFTASPSAPLVNLQTVPKTVDLNAPVNIATAPKTVNVENCKFTLIEKDAAHELAEGMKALAAPIQEFKNGFDSASAKAERDAELLAGALGIGMLLAVVGWIVTHFWHKADKAANFEPKA